MGRFRLFAADISNARSDWFSPTILHALLVPPRDPLQVGQLAVGRKRFNRRSYRHLKAWKKEDTCRTSTS